MSLTENDSGPFVIFFLPAVIGCLTILLARRWANSQVSNNSTTGVSRRRKIIKDPLAKRTLPLLTCKMLPPGSKKANGASKKGILLQEEDFNGSKRYNRNFLPPNIIMEKNADSYYLPKHVPFPQIPQDSDVTFEIMDFVFTVTAAGLQFLNLYRTMWYLPDSYTDQSMHFHLIDTYLVAFILVILSRRLLYSLCILAVNKFLEPDKAKLSIPSVRMFLLGIVLGMMGWCTYHISIKYPMLKLFYLCYPALIYFALFGFQSSPFLELNNSDVPILHNCSPIPSHIRAEVEVMREDFNLKVKKILFNSVIGAYYTSFIPCCFAQAYLYYDRERALQQVAFVWGALFCRTARLALSAAACDAPHRAAQHLGCWIKDEHSGPAEPWCDKRVYQMWERSEAGGGGGGTYVAQSRLVAAEPGNTQHYSFYGVFNNPSTLLCVLLCLQMSLILVQICLLFTSSPWTHFVAIYLLLTINYHTMFNLVRDYLIAWKVYRTERMLQAKNDMTTLS